MYVYLQNSRETLGLLKTKWSLLKFGQKMFFCYQIVLRLIQKKIY